MMIDELGFRLAVAFAASGLALVSGISLAPKYDLKDYFEVTEYEAHRTGDTAVFDYTRIIHRPIVMGYTVRIMEQVGDSYAQFCSMSFPPFEYRPENIPPDIVTLEYWTNGLCPNLPEGPARIVTTWLPAVLGMAPLVKATHVEGKK